MNAKTMYRFCTYLAFGLALLGLIASLALYPATLFNLAYSLGHAAPVKIMQVDPQQMNALKMAPAVSLKMAPAAG